MFPCLDRFTLEAPVDTEYLEYDKRFHRWILTEKAIKDFTGHSFQKFAGDPTMSLAKRREFSQDIYMEIKKYSTMSTFIIKEYYMSLAIELKDTILEALIAQARYSIRSGGNFFKDQHGLSINKGTALNTKGYSINERVLDILEGSLLMYRGNLFLLNQEFEKGTDY